MEEVMLKEVREIVTKALDEAIAAKASFVKLISDGNFSPEALDLYLRKRAAKEAALYLDIRVSKANNESEAIEAAEEVKRQLTEDALYIWAEREENPTIAYWANPRMDGKSDIVREIDKLLRQAAE
jgi:hypothetical protein